MILAESSCACETCKAACRRRPGIFRPDEPEKAAELLGMDPEHFALRFLAVARLNDALVVLPAVVGMMPGTAYGPTDIGTCVFLDDAGLCKIYEARPYGCAHGNPCERSPEVDAAYYAEMAETARLWTEA